MSEVRIPLTSLQVRSEPNPDYLSVDDEAVLPHVADPEDHAQLLVPLADDGLLAEHYGSRPEKQTN